MMTSADANPESRSVRISGGSITITTDRAPSDAILSAWPPTDSSKRERTSDATTRVLKMWDSTIRGYDRARLG